MSTLVGSVLDTTLTQNFSLTLDEVQSIGSIRPHIMSVGDPSGTFTYKIKSGGDTLASKSFTVSDCKTDLSTSSTRFHMYKALTFDNEVQLKKGEYSLELSSSGYSAGANYLAWLSDWDSFYFDISNESVDNLEKPFSFELWSYKRRVFK